MIELNLVAYYMIDNKLYSMPFNASTPIMYYNKDIFPKVRGVIETEIENMLAGIDADTVIGNRAAQINEAIEEYNLVN